MVSSQKSIICLKKYELNQLLLLFLNVVNSKLFIYSYHYMFIRFNIKDGKPLETPALNQPFPWAKQLVESLTPFAPIKSYRKGIRLGLIENDVPVCRLIHSGSIEVHRSSDGLLVVTLPAPGIIGLGVHDAFLVTAETCKVSTLTVAEMQQHISDNGLWEIAAQHMIVVTNKLYSYSKQMSAPTAYEVIRNQLRELSHEPAHLRENVTIERYIRDKTHLSRSSIMKILSELKTGGYIVIKDGRLCEIKHLPAKY